MNKDKIIAIIGLGYAGLPLAVEFGKKYQTIGFDINHCRVREIKDGQDLTQEVTSKALNTVIVKTSEHLSLNNLGYCPLHNL